MGSGGRVTWWRERSRKDEWTGKCRRRWREQRESNRYESERGKRGVMRATGRLIHIQRQNSLKRLRDAKRLVQLTVCPTYCPAIPPPSLSLCPLYLHLPGSYNYPPPPPPAIMSIVPPVAMSTTPPPPAPILEPVSSSDFLPALISN